MERDYNLAQRIVRDTIRVTSLRKCEDACDNAILFTCRSFAYSTSINANYNCYLTDRFGSELDSGFDLVRDFDAIVYQQTPDCQIDYYKGGRAEGKNLKFKMVF